MIYDAYGQLYKSEKQKQREKRNAEEMVLQLIAPQVMNNEQLRDLLRKAHADRRRDVYNMIVPHLPFTPLGYSMLV